MVPPCSRRVSRARRYSRPPQLRAYRTITFFGLPFQTVHHATGLSAFARRYLRSRCCFPFLWVLRCFSSPGSLRAPMHSVHDDPLRAGFPHSDIPVSQLASSSTGLFAGSHVLHRLLTPRHPPCALIRLIAPTGRRRLLKSHANLTPPAPVSQRRQRFILKPQDIHFASVCVVAIHPPIGQEE